MPIFVTPMSAVVDRLIVTNSRIVLLFPMTTRVSSPRYLRSWGGAPMEANWKMRLFSPMSVWLWMTTLGPMMVPFPIVTPGPITLNGPISTLSAIFASGDMTAEGCMFIFVPLRRKAHSERRGAGTGRRFRPAASCARGVMG